MRVLMLGWEFPPFISGGLGTACYGLTRGLDALGTRVIFVLPRAVAPAIDPASAAHVDLRTPQTGRRGSAAGATRSRGAGQPGDADPAMFTQAQFRLVDSKLNPYARPGDLAADTAEGAAPRTPPVLDARAPVADGRQTWLEQTAGIRPIAALGGDAAAGPGGHYQGDLFAEVERYAQEAVRVAADDDFELVHAHDWMTFPAGIALARLRGRPLVVHVHSTEFDRSGVHVHQRIYDIERAGMHSATRVIGVSHLTRNLIINRYGVSPSKVDVVYNAIDENGSSPAGDLPPIRREDRIVLFLGRITMQKGPEYFIAAARRVLEVMDNVRFVMAGTGDMIRRVIEMAAELGIGHKVLFTGFLRGDDVRKIFRMADLYVMPSVSEPFGIAPLEALSNEVPVLISKQSGVAEVLTHALKVDFWDIDEMANKIVAVLKHPPLQRTLRQHGNFEVRRFSWTDSAGRCVQVYRKALGLSAE